MSGGYDTRRLRSSAGDQSLVWYPDLPHTTSQGFYLLSWAWMDMYLK